MRFEGYKFPTDNYMFKVNNRMSLLLILNLFHTLF